jgi:hypothetical protein
MNSMAIRIHRMAAHPLLGERVAGGRVRGTAMNEIPALGLAKATFPLTPTLSLWERGKSAPPQTIPSAWAGYFFT